MRWPFLAGMLSLLASAALAQPSSISTPAGRQLTLPGPVPLGNGPSLDLNFVDGSAMDARITFTRASVASYFNAVGAIQSAAVNTPRIDYDPVTRIVRGLLIEEGRTNLLLNSATLVTQSVTVTAQAYTLSFYSTGSVALSGSCAGSPVGTGAFPSRVALTFTATAGTCTLTVTGSVLNANLEAGPIPTSWIATTGTTATRAADAATMPWAVTFPATAAVEAMLPAISPTLQQGLVIFDDGSAVNRLMLRENSSNLQLVSVVASATVAAISMANAVAGSVFKVAGAASGGVWNASTNGATPVSASGAAAAGLTTLRLGQNSIGTGFTDGYIRRVRYWPRALSNGELQGATT